MKDYTRPDMQESAIANMLETEKIAKEVVQECEKLSEAFSLLGDAQSQGLCLTCQDEVLVASALRGGRSSCQTKVLETSTKFIDNITNLQGKILANLRNIEYLWKKFAIYCITLEHSSLPDFIESEIQCDKPSPIPVKFFEEVTEAEKALDGEALDFQAKKNLAEVVQSMKTGRSNIEDTPRKASLLEMGCFGKVEQQFEYSYINWLALAQMNQIMQSIIREAICDVEKAQCVMAKADDSLLEKALREKGSLE